MDPICLTKNGNSPPNPNKEFGLQSSMSNGSGTVIGEANINGPFNNKYKLKDKEEESYGGMAISQSPSCQEMVNKTGGI